MRILFAVHLYPPTHNCGGEFYIHNMAKYLISKGHECRVLLKQAEWHNIDQIYNYEGVEVYPAKIVDEMEHYHWSELVFSHLDYGADTMQKCVIFKKRFIFIAHNDCQDEYDAIYHPRKPCNVIFNSRWISDKIKNDNRSMVLHPPTDWRKYDLENLFDHEIPLSEKKKITLINLNDNKGGQLFSTIANLSPKRQFLAVKGSYDPQNVPKWENVVIRENSPDILPVYAQTRILLMPSKYESWGMTATEAMCNGIPVICSPTAGLQENCSYAGIYVDRNDVKGWLKAIKSLDNPAVYEKYSKLARQRSRELDPAAEYEQLEQFIYEAV